MTLRDGDYITMRSADTIMDRADCLAQLEQNGCRSIRFAVLDDGRLQVHGYLKLMECGKCKQPARVFNGTWCEACSA